MAAPGLILLLLTISIASAQETLFTNGQVSIFHTEKGIGWSVNNKNGKLGLQGVISAGKPVPTGDCDSSNALFCRQDAHTRIKVELELPNSCIHVTTDTQNLTSEVRDCVSLGTANWFGGSEQYNQLWPIEKQTFKDYSYVTKEADWMAVVERYWLNSNGIYLYVQPDVPLFIDQNNYQNNSLCFIAKNKAPYLESRTTLSLTYSICGLNAANAKEAHQDAILQVLNKPEGIVDDRMVRYPIWSTWARYKGEINQDLVLQFANEIVSNGFNNSQLEIDDNWETCYGSLTVDTSESKFPNMSALNQNLKDLGFRVTIWIHPFLNSDCKPYFTFATEQNYLIKNEDGDVTTNWWRGTGGTIDFTNPDAVTWWVNRLQLLIDNELIDSFKFDAGESSFAPQVPVLSATPEEQPNILSVKYAETCSQFGSFIEVRVGSRTQYLPVFVRMLDKDSRWGFNNGLKSLVTTLLTMNIAGYPFVLPDMIGGNGYGERPTKELFIRWLQANTFMPALQFSFVPWDYDQETIDISKRFTALHAEYSDLIMDLIRKARADGTPVNPPIWWIDPEDSIATAIDDEFMLGDSILIAPILEEGATSRDIYLPKGLWRDHYNQIDMIAPVWIRSYQAPLDTLPYFTKISDKP